MSGAQADRRQERRPLRHCPAQKQRLTRPHLIAVDLDEPVAPQGAQIGPECPAAGRVAGALAELLARERARVDTD